MQRHKIIKQIKTSLFLALFLFSSIVNFTLIAANNEFATENNLEPKQSLQSNVITFEDIVPTIDGNINETEWINATRYELQAGGRKFTVRVLCNLTHIFMGIDYRTNIFVPINVTVPPGEDYNNETHSWYAIVFDRNFDLKIGSETYPDDLLLMNYRYNGTQDGFIKGSKNDSIVLDVDVNGTDHTFGALNYTYDPIEILPYRVSFEVAKKLNSRDVKGNDIALNPGDAIPFSLMYYENHTALYNVTKEEAFSDWKYIRLEPLHSVYTLVEDIEDISILTLFSRSKDTTRDGFKPMHNYFMSYGWDATWDYASSYNFDLSNMNQYTVIVLVGALDQISSKDVEAIRSYVANGGNVLLLGDATRRNSKVNDILNHFEMEAYINPLYLNDTAVNASLTISVDDMDTSLPYISQDLSLTNQSLEEIFYIGTALRFNTTEGFNRIQVQEANLYPIINATGEYYINKDPIGLYNASIDLNLNGSAILQAGLELQRGGKLIVSASSDMFNESYFGQFDNKQLLLREMLWLMDTQFAIQKADFEMDQHTIIQGDSISVNITVTTDNNTVLDNVTVIVHVMRLKRNRNEELLSTTNGKNFTGTIEPQDTGYLELQVRIHKKGYGFNETEVIQIYVEPARATPPKVNIVLLIIFLVSVGLVVVGGISFSKSKKI